MSSPPRPNAAVRTALTLVAVLILYRLLLISGTLQDFIAAARGPGVESGGVTPDLALGADQLSFPKWTRVPGSFGSPFLTLLLLPLMIVARRMMRKGYELAARIFLGFLGLRALMVVTQGPWNSHAATLLLIMLSIAGLLSLPTSQEWFRECARWRKSHQ